MLLFAHKVDIEASGEKSQHYVFLIEQNAREKINDSLKHLKSIGYELNPNSSPEHLKLINFDKGLWVSLHYQRTEFDDNKIFYAPTLTIRDLT